MEIRYNAANISVPPHTDPGLSLNELKIFSQYKDLVYRMDGQLFHMISDIQAGCMEWTNFHFGVCDSLFYGLVFIRVDLELAIWPSTWSYLP